MDLNRHFQAGLTAHGMLVMEWNDGMVGFILNFIQKKKNIKLTVCYETNRKEKETNRQYLNL